MQLLRILETGCEVPLIAMLLGGGSNPQGFGKEQAILAAGFVEGGRHISNKPTHSSVVLLAVGKKEQLVSGMEINQGPTTGGRLDQITEMFEDKNAFNKIFPQPAIIEPTVLLHRQKRKVSGECPGEHAGSNIAGHALL